MTKSVFNVFTQKLLRIHPALLRKDNYFKTLPEGKLVKILASNQPSPSKAQVVNQAQQTNHEDLLVIQTPVNDAIDTIPNQKNISTKTVQYIDTIPDQKTISTQTCQDEVVLPNLIKISKLEGEVTKMDHNQDLLLSELNL